MEEEKPGKKHERGTDYRVFFILGICLMGLGISLTSAVGPAFISFLGVGAVFMMIGLVNRDKWRNPGRKPE